MILLSNHSKKCQKWNDRISEAFALGKREIIYQIMHNQKTATLINGLPENYVHEIKKYEPDFMSSCLISEITIYLLVSRGPIVNYSIGHNVSISSTHPAPLSPASNDTSTYGFSSASKVEAFPSIQSDDAEGEPAPDKPLSCRSFKTLNHEDNLYIHICNVLTTKVTFQSISKVSGKDITTEYLPFIINGKIFERINGNFRDEYITLRLEESDYFKILNFRIIQNNQTCFHQCPNPTWQLNFFRCIREGMNQLFKMRLDENAIYKPAGKTHKEYYDSPTCYQFVRYLALNIADDAIPVAVCGHKVTEENIEPFSIMSLVTYDKGNINNAHTFIHIAHGICLHKKGSNFICFQTIDKIKKFYEDFYEVNFQLIKNSFKQ